MGCTQSKIDNDEVVTRCKERKKFMKDAVAARNAFAAAHSSYAVSLKNTGAVLSDFVHGEVHNLNQLNHTASPGPGGGVSTVVAPPQPPLVETLPPPPPPPEAVSGFSESPLQRAASMPEIKMPPKSKQREMTATIIEEEDEDDEIESKERLIRKSRSRKIGGGGSSRGNRRETTEEQRALPAVAGTRPVQAPSQHNSAYDYFFPHEDSIPGPNLADVEEVRVEKGEVEWKVFEETSQMKEEVVVGQKAAATVEMDRMAKKTVAGTSKGTKKDGSGSGALQSAGEKRVLKGSVNLVQIFVECDDHFLSAFQSAHEVSKMLEATRLHYHSNFSDNRGHIDHSARVMRVITWNRSFRGLMHVDDGKDDFDSEENETHAAVLDKLLAWEKKFYNEVKAGEVMKTEYRRKVAMLNKLKKRDTNSEALEKAKGSLSHLHTRYIVDMQSLDSTASEINHLRDERLHRKLVQLVDGMANMWQTMRVCHESQARIATALRALNLSQSPKKTSEDHHLRTYQLCGVVREWHSQFCKLVDCQKEYIGALKSWLKLNLVPIESTVKEKVSSPLRVQSPPIHKLILSWHDLLDKLQDGVARTAISNFAAVIETIMHHQDDEIKSKGRCEETRKELVRKTRQFEDWYNKYMQRRTPEELDPESTDSNTRDDTVAERQLAVELLKKRLVEEEEAYQRLCVQVREKSLTTLKTRLPELFRAMSDVALSFSEMYSYLMSISDQKKPSQSSR